MAQNTFDTTKIDWFVSLHINQDQTEVFCWIIYCRISGEMILLCLGWSRWIICGYVIKQLCVLWLFKTILLTSRQSNRSVLLPIHWRQWNLQEIHWTVTTVKYKILNLFSWAEKIQHKIFYYLYVSFKDVLIWMHVYFYAIQWNMKIWKKVAIYCDVRMYNDTMISQQTTNR